MDVLRLFALLAIGSTLLVTHGSAANPRPIHSIVSELRRFPVDANREMDVPPRVAVNLTELKHALRDLVINVAASPDAADLSSHALGARVIERLEREDVPVGDDGEFGAIQEIEFRRPPEYPAWLTVTTTLSIPYGSDTSLYLFEMRGRLWKHVLTVESNGYSKISGAQGWMKYFVAPPMPGHKPYLVTADITPSSASVWQGLRVKVLRIGRAPESPMVLSQRMLSYCLEDAYYFAIRANGLGLIFLTHAANPELTGGRGVHYLEYSVSNRRASRVQEVTIDPYDVVAKWTREDWPIASQSVDASAEVGLREWHRRFRAERWECGQGELRVSHRNDGSREQLVAVADCTCSDDATASAYVALAGGQRGFRILSISSEKPALPEESGDMVWNGGGAGLMDPVLERAVPPKLPADVLASGGIPRNLPFRIVVREDGSVDPAVRVRSWPLSDDRIVAPAIKAVREWRFKPGFKDGRPVKVSIDVDVAFE